LDAAESSAARRFGRAVPDWWVGQGRPAELLRETTFWRDERCLLLTEADVRVPAEALYRLGALEALLEVFRECGQIAKL
jgi:hypothetical protein